MTLAFTRSRARARAARAPPPPRPQVLARYLGQGVAARAEALEAHEGVDPMDKLWKFKEVTVAGVDARDSM